MEKVKCIICREEFSPVENERICEVCYQAIEKDLGIKTDKEGNILTKHKLENLLWEIAELFGKVEYLEHALKHHSHTSKTVEVVEIE